MGNGAVGVGWDGEPYPLTIKFRLPAGTFEFSARLPEGYDPEDRYIFYVYDTRYWQPVEFNARHKMGHDFYIIEFPLGLTVPVEVVIVKE